MKYLFLILSLVLFFSCSVEKDKKIEHLEFNLKRTESFLEKEKKISTNKEQRFLERIQDLRKQLNECGIQVRDQQKPNKLPLQILPLIRMHADDITENDINATWIGFFISEDGFYTDNVKVNFKRVHDPIMDEDSVKTGWLPVIENNSDSCLYIISGLSGSKRSIAKHLEIKEKIILPGDTSTYTFLANEYKLWATGRNYNPYMLYFQRNSEKPQMLVYEAGFDDEMTDLLWMGDIDQDGLLDLIIDTSNHYNVMEISLYLSSYASLGNSLGKVAVTGLVGC